VKSCPLTGEKVSSFDTMVSRAKQEKEDKNKRKRSLLEDRIEFLDGLRYRPAGRWIIGGMEGRE